VAQIHAGTTHYIIPDEARLQGTIRSLTPAVRRRTRDLVRQIVTQTAAAFGAKADVELEEGYPSLINHPEAADLVARVGREVVGQADVITDEPPSMGGEDFAYYAEKVPAAFFRLGTRPRDVPSAPGLHTPQFDFNDDALPVGAAMFCGIARRFLEGK